MARFRFIHAADLHLDSPLLGLSRKSEELAGRVEEASRRAFDGLIQLAIEEKCSFIVIAGDLFDGQWRHYQTGLYFADRMRRLQEADIGVYMILGNHDAENQFASRLPLSANVHLFSPRKAESVDIASLGVSIHGRSYPRRDVTDNIALDYPPPSPGSFNIGLLHTACSGREGHASYAPCTVEQLANHGYDYWALGHVHAYEVLHENPRIVFAGNLQGRSARETGPKGACLATVDDGRLVEFEHRPLDRIRWQAPSVDLSLCGRWQDAMNSIRNSIETAKSDSSGRGLALRMRLRGTTEAHGQIVRSGRELREEVETIAAALSDEIWIEKILVETSPPKRPSEVDPSVAGRLRAIIEEFGKDPAFEKLLEEKLEQVRNRMPASARDSELFEGICRDAPARSIELALSHIDGEGG